MEDVTIPGWALMVMGALVLPWMVWLTFETVNNRRDIAVSVANDVSVNNELVKLNLAVEKLDTKLNLFLSNEIELLKEALNRVSR